MEKQKGDKVDAIERGTETERYSDREPEEKSMGPHLAAWYTLGSWC